MRRFRFRLDRVRRLRAQEERVARRALGAALAEVAAIDQELQQLRDSLQACRAEQGSAAEALAQAIGRSLAETELKTQSRRQAAALEVDRAQELYRAKRRDLRAIERLEEKERDEWRKECMADEQREADEMVRARAWANREVAQR